MVIQEEVEGLDIAYIVGRIGEIRAYEQEGLIHAPNVSLEQIVGDIQAYFQKLKTTFPKIKRGVLEDISTFTSNAYITLLDKEFVGNKSGAVNYEPASFLNSAREISLEFSNIGQVGEFYSKLASNFSKSNRFIYNLVVKDLYGVLGGVMKRSDYSKEAFTSFVLEILDRAMPYSEGQVKDKWSIFKPIFEDTKNKYFPEINNQDRFERQSEDISIDYIAGLVESQAKRGGFQAEQLLSDELGTVYGVDVRKDRSGNRGNIGRIVLYTSDPNYPIRRVIGVDRAISSEVVNFFINIADLALTNLRGRGYSGQLLITTTQAKTVISNYL